MAVRVAGVEDIPALIPLVERYWAFESIAGFDRPRIELLLRSLLGEPLRGTCWVATAGGTLQGYLLAVFVFSLEHGGLMAEIDELFVSPAIRSQGAGALLLAAAERDMSARGLVRLQLQLGVGNERARAFYERCGFEPRSGYALLDKPLNAR